MSNLHTAQEAIRAEIAHSKQGMSYYAERVKSLERALEDLAGVAGSVHAPSRPMAKKQAGVKPEVKGSRRSTAAIDSRQEADLPSTGGDYWKNLITESPKAAADILNDSVSQLGFIPTKAQVAKLKNRLTFSLNAMVKAGEIRDSGSGRARRFFRA